MTSTGSGQRVSCGEEEDDDEVEDTEDLLEGLGAVAVMEGMGLADGMVGGEGGWNGRYILVGISSRPL